MTTQTNTPSQLLGQINNQTKPIDDTVNNHLIILRPEIEKRTRTYTNFKPLHYKTQMVSGTNYFVKIHVGDNDSDECIHVRFYRDLQNNLSLHSLSENRTLTEHISFF